MRSPESAPCTDRGRRLLAGWALRADRGGRASSRGSASVEPVYSQPSGSFCSMGLQVWEPHSRWNRLYWRDTRKMNLQKHSRLLIIGLKMYHMHIFWSRLNFGTNAEWCLFMVVIESVFTGSPGVAGDPEFSLFKREISKQKEDNQTGSTSRSGDLILRQCVQDIIARHIHINILLFTLVLNLKFPLWIYSYVILACLRFSLSHSLFLQTLTSRLFLWGLWGGSSC